MRKGLLVATMMVAITLSGCLNNQGNDVDGAPDTLQLSALDANQDDVVVIAVIDSGFNPYHHDFLADFMPQQMDEDLSNDLPLDAAPHTWIPGFPNPGDAFASYSSINLTLTPDNPDAQMMCTPTEGESPTIGAPSGSGDAVECDYEEGGLYQHDADAWANVSRSTVDDVNFHYVPGTKVVGYVNFNTGSGFQSGSHGVGTTSVSVGNLHGSCPQCVLVFINGQSESADSSDAGQPAIDWVNRQPWIDLVTNSYGHSSFYRENVWDHCNLDLERVAVERGQQIFWSAGNGQANAFVAPVYTLNSCQKGPDWIVTVGAIDPDTNASFTGHGKPVNIANIGTDYPSAYGSTNVTNGGNFGGTSNAAPLTAGTYGAALSQLRAMFPGASKMQKDGVIATGPAGCGIANSECAMVDGELTVHELRQAMYLAATPTEEYFTDGQVGFLYGDDYPVGTPETELMTEGFGSLHGKLVDLDAEVQLIIDLVLGDAVEEIDQETMAFMIAYSYCSQQVWGEWDYGYWNAETALPEASSDWPFRTFLSTQCPVITRTAVDAATMVGPFNHL
jgi:hypothetical protein